MHPVLDRVKELGLVVFTNGDYDLNIVGVRTANGTPNRFDDRLYCIYKVGESGESILGLLPQIQNLLAQQPY